MSRILTATVTAVALMSLVGCGDGPKLARVSGVVTLDGQPYPNAAVSFQPLASGGKMDVGMGSTALTDDKGRYTLITIDGKTGAVVGPHKVRIQIRREAGGAPIDPTVGSADGSDPKKKSTADPIPVEWYSDTGGKEFTVPDGGTDKADFAIESAKPTKKK